MRRLARSLIADASLRPRAHVHKVSSCALRSASLPASGFAIRVSSRERLRSAGRRSASLPERLRHPGAIRGCSAPATHVGATGRQSLRRPCTPRWRRRPPCCRWPSPCRPRALARAAPTPRAGLDHLARHVRPRLGQPLAGRRHRVGRVVLQGLLPVRRHPQRALPGPRHGVPAGRRAAGATWPPRSCALLGAFAAGIMVAAPLTAPDRAARPCPRDRRSSASAPRIAGRRRLGRGRHRDHRRRGLERHPAAARSPAQRRSRTDRHPRRPAGRRQPRHRGRHPRAQRRRRCSTRWSTP